MMAHQPDQPDQSHRLDQIDQPMYLSRNVPYDKDGSWPDPVANRFPRWREVGGCEAFGSDASFTTKHYSHID